MQVWVRDDEADIGIGKAQTAVLGVLFRRRGVDCAVYRLHDNVRGSAILSRVVKSELKFSSGQDLLNE